MADNAKYWLGSTILLCIVMGFGSVTSAQAPVADFTANITSGCGPVSVSFTDQSTNSPNQWNWDFGNSNNSILQNPSAIYTLPGTYTVTLTATNGSGSDTEVKTAYITVFQNPIAAISADTTNGCIPLSVQFSDASLPGSGVIDDWIWDFGDGNVSTLQNPFHEYVLDGSFSVSLTVTDTNGCQNTIFESNFINLSIPGTAIISGGPIDTCVFPFTASFGDLSIPGSSPIVNWLWDFGDGSPTSSSQNPSHNYTTAGSYDVTLIVSDSVGCVDTAVFASYVNLIDFQADFVLDTMSYCPNFILVFYDSTSPNPTSWNWDFDDGSSSTSQNPQHYYDSSGIYNVTLVAENAIGCIDSVTQAIDVNTPWASFTVDTSKSCETPLVVNFNSTVSEFVMKPLTYSWNFDDGSANVSVPNPTHSYTSDGIYIPYLIVTDGAGCADTFYLSDLPDTIVIISPVANFTMVPEFGGCAPLTVNFTETSFSALSTINSWSWNFDDPLSGGNDTSTLPNPIHTFDSMGVYSVELIVGTDWGCTDTVSIDVPVGITPVQVDFTMSDTIVCHNEVVSFTDLSIDSLNNWLWWFGNSTQSSTVQNPTYAFMDTGTMIITLIAGHNGCNDTMQHSLVVMPPIPIFTVSPTVGCTVPHFATYTDMSIGAETWLWDFGDGFTSTDTNTTHTYTAPGDYTVELEVTNSNGCIASEFASVVIPELNADFTTPDTLGCFSLTSFFTNSSTFNYTPSLTSYGWYFGDGYFSPSSNPSHLYQDTGVYEVTLTIVDYYGCIDSLVVPDYIHVNGVYPDFSFDLTTGCTPLTVNSVDSTVGTLPIDSWVWNFGDGSPMDSTQNATHIYSNPGIYSVQLTAADSNGCSDSINYPNIISTSRPIPSFSYKSPVCITEDIGIVNSSSGDGITYLWDFGDGNIDSAANPIHGYADTGIYIIMLVVTDSNGCDSSLFSFVTVEPPPTAGMIVDTLNTNCPPLVVSFLDSSSGNVTSWFWDFGDGATSANQNPIHTYSYPDTFDVTLVVSNATACADTLVLPNLIKIGGPYGSFTINPDSGCVPLDVTFQANAYNTTIYVWDFGDGFIDSVSGSTVMRTYLNVGTPHPVLILIDSLDCQLPAQLPDPDSLLIDDPAASFGSSTTLLYSTLCGVDTVYFFDSSTVQSPYTSIISWNWDFGDGGSDTVPNPYNIYADTGTYTVVLQVANTLGCIKYDTLTIEVELDTINVLTASVSLYNDVLCGGDNTGSATGLAIGGTMPYSYLWSDDSAQTTVQSTGLIAGAYTLWVVDSNGCTDSATITISEPAVLAADIIDSSMVTCNGYADGTAEAVASGGTGAYTYQWNDPSAQTSSVAANLDTDTLVITVADSLGCTAQDSIVITQPNVLMLSNGGQINVTCFGGADGEAIANTTGGTPPYTYLWSTVPVQTDTILDSLVAGNYTVTVQDTFNCVDSLIFVITEPPELYAQVIDTTSIGCYGQSTGEILIKAYGGVPPYTIDWPGVGDTGTTADSLWSGTHFYNVTDASGCTYSDNVWLSQPGEIVVVINVGDGVICTNGSDSVQASAVGGTPPLTYVWSGLGTGTSWKSVTPATTTTYQLDVTDGNNCNVQDSVQIIVYELIKVGVWADTVCVGDSIALEVYITEGMHSSYSYVWDFGDGVIDTTGDTNASHVYSNVGSSLINLTVIGPDACVTDSLVFDMVTILPSPVAWFSASAYITNTSNPLISFTDQSIGSVFGDVISSWYWDFGDQSYSDYPSVSHSYLDSGTYTVTHSVVNQLGCTDTVTVDIRINPNFEIEVPNAFTPDPNGGNGGAYVVDALDNNIFYPITKFVEEFHMTIFNRWGEMVFESFDLAIGWDGYYRSGLSQQDVYVWKIELRYIDGSVYQQIGDVTLVR